MAIQCDISAEFQLGKQVAILELFIIVFITRAWKIQRHDLMMNEYLGNLQNWISLYYSCSLSSSKFGWSDLYTS